MEKYFVGVQPNPANGLYQINYIRCYFKTTRKELRCLVSATSANSATCLPHIVTENCFKILKNARNQVLKSGCFSVNFAQYSKLAEDFRLVQFPYGSPFNVLGNSVISRFPSFLFLPILVLVRYLSATAHFGSGLFVLSCCILRKKTESSVHRLSHFCLCSLEHMGINVQSSSRIAMS